MEPQPWLARRVLPTDRLVQPTPNTTPDHGTDSLEGQSLGVPGGRLRESRLWSSSQNPQACR